ncbi:hypothetical protein E3N88_23186 [Mikania micrantha]|uniref:Uncharacterized protein n=1 Tax=Mikania micrantha TaxID=192012 RepID=A0A5N6NF70_9ASTR|nr:hypothetical protein E3N88_23186 [Mikania micrantha]
MNSVFKSFSDNENDDSLQKQFQNLEIEWDFIKKSISRSNRRSFTTVSGDHRLLHMYHNSPKQLMSLLQNENTPLKHQHQAAVEGIEHPEVDFDDGRLKGRRLFVESDVGSDDNGGCFDVDEQSEVSTEFSCKDFEGYHENCNRFCMDLPWSGVTERDGMVAAVKEGGGGGGSGGSVGKWIVCVVMVMFAFAIVAFECSGEEHVLVPT